jgi:hypothetical protein
VCGTLLLAFILPGAGRAQPPDSVRPLPPIDEETQLVAPARPGSAEWLFASDPSEYRSPNEVLPDPTSHLTSHKNGFFQKLSFTGTQVFQDGSDGLGMFETELFAAFALPAPTTETPLILMPTLETHFLSGPTYVALPPRLYTTYLDFLWLPKVGQRLQGMLSVAPSWYSDFAGDDAGFRWTGRAIARYDWIPDQLQFVLGVLYLDRFDYEFLPVGGIIWKPNDDWDFELVFPKAKIARRLGWGPDFENWVYLGGSFGGNDWSIATPGGVRELLIMKDWRLTLGWERKLNGGAGFSFEVGYVFQREFEFASTGAVYYPDDTLLLRGGLAF